MPTKEYFFEQIEKEFTTAREAVKIGNDGKARVCARRAAGQAILWFLTKHPHEGWDIDAMNLLLCLKDDPSFPQEVRDAATRLTTKISERFTYPFTSDPIADAHLIVDHIKNIMIPYAD